VLTFLNKEGGGKRELFRKEQLVRMPVGVSACRGSVSQKIPRRVFPRKRRRPAELLSSRLARLVPVLPCVPSRQVFFAMNNNLTTERAVLGVFAPTSYISFGDKVI
jgi:hypothetical protein